ncbi:MAG: hypothetical protein HXX18_08750 [Bacteroidetes bacterium]|nr:hypothetical protein [Bacteroidota bacterium]
MKKLFLFLFIFSTFTASAQVFVKGIAYITPFQIDGKIYSSVSFGIEYKKRHLGVEYLFSKYYSQHDGPSLNIYTQQLALKYYINKPDAKFKLYTSAFIHFKNLTAQAYEPIPEFNGNTKSVKGIGYGVLLGNTFDLGKHFGVESGLSIYYLSINDNFQFQGGWFDELKSNYHVGLRFLLYFKME